MYNPNPALTQPFGKTFEEFEARARLCAHQTRLLLQMANDAETAAVEMWRMAKEHQHAAAELNSGALPDIREEPFA